MPTAIQLIIGLGNPGPQYEATRHNAGVWMMSVLCHQNHLVLNHEKKFFGDYCNALVEGEKAHLLLPTTFMNNSGQAVQAVANFYKIPTEAILVLHDELDLLPGHVKLKRGGGHAGHNGLRSIIQTLGSPDFWRLRIGIGHPGQRDKVTPFVLSAPGKQELQKIHDSIITASHIFPAVLTGEIESAMRCLHTKE